MNRKQAILLRKAAYLWWKSKRPIEWNTKHHLENPHINLVTKAERDLADAYLACETFIKTT